MSPVMMYFFVLMLAIVLYAAAGCVLLQPYCEALANVPYAILSMINLALLELPMEEECFEVGIVSWWRHQMETFSALLAFCEGNSPVTAEFPS